jgi:GLPGLI family protein
MKKQLFALFTGVLLSLSACAGGGNEKGGFIGKIEYTMEYDLPEAYESQRAMMPTEMTTYIGKDFTRVEQTTGLGEQITINDLKSGGSKVLMNMMGQKIALSTEGADKEFEPIVEELEGTKEIAGYLCKQVRYSVPNKDGGEDVSYTIYYSEEIGSEANTQFPGLNGFPMEYVIEAQGMTITYSAKKVTEEKVSKDLAKVPEGYEEMSYEDFLKMMGQE